MITRSAIRITHALDMRRHARVQFSRALNRFPLGRFNGTRPVRVRASNRVIALRASLYIDALVTHRHHLRGMLEEFRTQRHAPEAVGPQEIDECRFRPWAGTLCRSVCVAPA